MKIKVKKKDRKLVLCLGIITLISVGAFLYTTTLKAGYNLPDCLEAQTRCYDLTNRVFPYEADVNHNNIIDSSEASDQALANFPTGETTISDGSTLKTCWAAIRCGYYNVLPISSTTTTTIFSTTTTLCTTGGCVKPPFDYMPYLIVTMGVVILYAYLKGVN